MGLSPEGIAAILVGLSTFLGGIALAYRGLRGDTFQRKVTESAALLSGYTEMVGNLRKEIDAIRDAHAKDQQRATDHHRVELENTNFLHEEERSRWRAERERLEERVDQLEAQVAALLFNRPREA